MPNIRSPGCMCCLEDSCTYHYNRYFPGNNFQVEHGKWLYAGTSYPTSLFTRDSDASVRILYEPPYQNGALHAILEIDFMAGPPGDTVVFDFGGTPVTITWILNPTGFWGDELPEYPTGFRVSVGGKTREWPNVNRYVRGVIWTDGTRGFVVFGDPRDTYWGFAVSEPLWARFSASLPVRLQTKQNLNGIRIQAPVFKKVTQECYPGARGFCTETGGAPDEITLNVNCLVGDCGVANGSYVLKRSVWAAGHPFDSLTYARYKLESSVPLGRAENCCRLACGGGGWVDIGGPLIRDPRCPPDTSITHIAHPTDELWAYAEALISRSYHPYIDSSCSNHIETASLYLGCFTGEPPASWVGVGTYHVSYHSYWDGPSGYVGPNTREGCCEVDPNGSMWLDYERMQL